MTDSLASTEKTSHETAGQQMLAILENTVPEHGNEDTQRSDTISLHASVSGAKNDFSNNGAHATKEYYDASLHKERKGIHAFKGRIFHGLLLDI